MAQEDNYKEGVDFEYVQGNGDDNSNFKTRHFFTKAEKEARKNPKPVAKAAPKAATKPKAKPKAAPKAGKITVTSLNPDTPPGSKPAGMPGKKKDSGFSIPGAAAAIAAGSSMLGAGLRGTKASATMPKLLPAPPKALPAPPKALPAPPKALPAPQKLIEKESAASEATTKPKSSVRKTISPKIAAPESKPSKSQNSRRIGRVGGPMMGEDPMFHAIGGGGFGSVEELGRDALFNMNKGGVVKMKEGSAKDTREDKAMAKKSGMSMKKWESSAADVKHDAPNKMSSGGITKRGMGVTKKATGGSMRGTGAAVRGKGFSGCY
jgi:hypothetical protein